MVNTQSGERRLIGEMLPIREISKAGAAEKGRGTGRINNLHRWWATRPTTVSRVTAYAALTSPPLSDHDDIIHEMCDYAKTTDYTKPAIRDRVRLRLQKTGLGGGCPKVLDPFGGSGALPFAAAWLGCESHSMDYNPVAVFIQKCALEYPAKYGERLLKDVWEAADTIQNEIREAVGEFYPDHTMDDGLTYELYGYRWCRTMPCVCGVAIPLVKSYVLIEGDDTCVYPKIGGKVVRFGIAGGSYGPIPDGFDPKKGSIGGNVIKCPACGNTYTNIEMLDAFNEGKGGEQMMVAVYTHPKKRGRFYAKIDVGDDESYDTCAAELERRRTQFRAEYGVDPIPSEIIPTPDGREYSSGGPYWTKTGIVVHGYTRWEHLFNTRQLLCLVRIQDILRRTEKRLTTQYGEEYGCVVMSYMALILDKTVEKYCRLSVWRVDSGRVVDCFASQSLKPTADYADVAPHIIWQQSKESVLSGMRAALSAADGSTYVIQHGSATKIPYDNEYFDAVCTDPPYYDSIHYSKTADFFYVWLKRVVGHMPVYKGLFRGVSSPDMDEVVQTTGDVSRLDRTSSLLRDKDGYQNLMTKSLQEMYRVLKYDGILTLVYTHKSTDGWETLIQSMLDAGFVVTAAWPIDTESKSRIGAQDTASLASSIYMVGRKWKKEPKEYYSEVRDELRAHVCGRLDKFMDAGVTGADFYIAAIGASCEIYGKYEIVIRDDDGSKVTVSDILAEIRGICSDHIVKTLTAGPAGDIDAMSKLYISWRWAYGDQPVPYDVARKLFTGVGLDIDDHVGTLLKKTGQNITMLDHTHRETNHTKNTIDILHKALRLWRAQETDEMNDLLVSTGNQNSDKFNRVIQAIIEAGAPQPGIHPETHERRDLAAFQSRAGVPQTHVIAGSIDDFV